MFSSPDGNGTNDSTSCQRFFQLIIPCLFPTVHAIPTFELPPDPIATIRRVFFGEVTDFPFQRKHASFVIPNLLIGTKTVLQFHIYFLLIR